MGGRAVPSPFGGPLKIRSGEMGPEPIHGGSIEGTQNGVKK